MTTRKLKLLLDRLEPYIDRLVAMLEDVDSPEPDPVVHIRLKSNNYTVRVIPLSEIETMSEIAGHGRLHLRHEVVIADGSLDDTILKIAKASGTLSPTFEVIR